MTTLIIALTAFTVLCLAFRELRGLGVAGAVVLILAAPLVFGALLVLAALIYFLFFGRTRHEMSPRGNVLPPDEASRRRSGLGMLVVAAAVAGVIALGHTPPDEDEAGNGVVQGPTRSAPAEEVIVVRSHGGLLQTATIQAEEALDATFTHRVFGVKIGETAPRVRVKAFYHYHVKLDPEWPVVRKGGVITALAPPLTPSFPVGIDTATIEKAVAGTWLIVPITGDADLEALERTITARLARKASSDEYKRRALEESRKTISEFIRNWAVQSGHTGVRSVRVVFEGEPIRSIESIAG